jgi:AcrR family transcriptional regulator
MNTVSTETRQYTLKARAEAQAKTRARIAAAASELHEEVGVARTTVSDIARRAGVSRLTVYNHFPDLGALLPACSAHYLAQHPMPDLEPALAQDDPLARVRGVLTLLYERYAETEAMTAGLLADRESVPELDEFMGRTGDVRMEQLKAALVEGFDLRGRKATAVRALLGLALEFWTWRQLHREGLADAQAAELMVGVIRDAAGA